MEKIINEVTEKLNREMKEFFSGREADVGTAERYFGNRIAEAVLELLRAYYEKCDRELLVDKVGRKQAGLVVERRRDKREILTQLGRLEYERTSPDRGTVLSSYLETLQRQGDSSFVLSGNSLNDGFTDRWTDRGTVLSSYLETLSMVDLLIVVSLASWRMEIPGIMGHGTRGRLLVPHSVGSGAGNPPSI